jgi:hypothetical protein
MKPLRLATIALAAIEWRMFRFQTSYSHHAGK